ncbi:hypothetical protein OESDEN_03028 [Oesophagostomum dentatum]|uniref:glucuronosyltransferase n=1 Tax=Oesophagostomum dentatum TaxID=61180 RepID=A0A0B1TNL1_OESDE|nr:hypothetical protein OESDEN_03028 [Oesophagostomum dentatum]
MSKLFFVELFLFLPSLAVGYKMAIYVPNMANSQVLFSVRVAETLSRAKHDVTMIMITPFDDAEHKYVKIGKEVKVHYVNASCGIRKADFDEMMHSIIFEDISVWDPKYYESMGKMTDITKGICRKLLENKAFLKWLAAEKFDLAFAHIMSMCPIGIIHLVRIPTWIWLDR